MPVLSNGYKEFIKENCDFEVSESIYNKIENINLDNSPVTCQGIKETKEAAGQCCVGGQCSECCTGDACNNPNSYPVVFVHGHSSLSWNSLDYSINAFEKFQNQMSNEGYISMGIILPESDINKVKSGAWGSINQPVSVRTTYYKGVYDETGRTIGKEQDKSIDEYSQRLEDTVNTILHHTGRDKVIIVAHSMGGLVSRNYIKNHGGSDKVYKLITIGTPNHGVWEDDSAGGLDAGLCGLTHGGLQECEDMMFDSTFITQLNEDYESHQNVNTLAVVGVCEECNYWNNKYKENYQNDEVVRVSSAKLNGAKNVEIKGHLVSGTATFHQDLTSNDEVYNTIKDFIKS